MPLAALALIAAAGWSPTQSFDAGAAQFHEPVPRVAIDATGKALLAYETGGAQKLVVRVRHNGRFGAPVTLARKTLDYAVAPGAVAYEARDGIHVAVLRGKTFKDRRIASSSGSEINGVTIAADPLGGWVVAERRFPRKGSAVPYRVRALSLDPTGAPTGPPQDLGLGQFGLDARPTQALAVLPDGRAVLVFQRERVDYGDPQPVVYAVRPHGGAFTEPVVVGEGLTDPRVTVAGDRAVLTATMSALCGDTSCAGQPRAIPLNPDGTLGPPTGPTVARASRAFAPWAAPGALVFQLKTRPKPFSREAPIRAASLTQDGPLQTLTRQPATEPVALPLDGDRTLALWATRRSFGAALAGPDGAFRKTAAPVGPPPEIYHSNPTNRDVRAAGTYAIVAWSRGHTVRVSLRRF
jgi:hypothetical protein